MPDTAPSGSSLAARCTACSTVFRVVPDQLRVSEGWVRCGRCSQVFNAAENLIDLDTGAPRRLDLGGSPTAARSPGPAQADPASAEFDSAMAATQPLYGPATAYPQAVDDSAREAARAWPQQEPETETETDPETVEETGPVRAPELQPELIPTAAGSETTAPAGTDTAPTAAAAAAETHTAQTPAAAELPAPMPSFVRRADRAARWRQPQVRAALAGGTALAALVLALQLLLTYRDLAAARWPGLRPALVASCELLRCRVGPAQAIEALSVESSGLVRVEKTALYQLSVALRNRAAIELAVPALELSLTDAQGRLLSRRVLLAGELGVSQPTVAAGRDLALQATLQTAPSSTGAEAEGIVVGYTIELFYP